MGYIYKISNKINSKVYIGKTSTTILNRWYHHKNDYKKYDWHLYRAMRKYGIENFFIEEVEKCPDDILNEREKYWINFYNSFIEGYNSTEGGEGRIQLNREIIKEKWEEGLSCKEIANLMDTLPSSIIQVLKQLNLYDLEEVKRRKMIEIANAQSEKRVIQYDENGNIIEYYNSVLEAAEKIGAPSATIWSGISSGGSRHGYFWGREGEPIPKCHKIIRPQIKEIYQYDKNNNLLNSFPNAAEAARQLKVKSAGNILKACKGQRKTAYGYYWSYERKK